MKRKPNWELEAEAKLGYMAKADRLEKEIIPDLVDCLKKSMYFLPSDKGLPSEFYYRCYEAVKKAGGWDK